MTLRGALLIGIAMLGGCLDVNYTVCGDNYCAEGQLCSPAGDTCVFPEQIETCTDLADGAFCSYSGVAVGACMGGVCFSQTTGTLPAPETLAATDGSSSDQVELTWSEVEGASGYRVYRDSFPVADVTTTAYTDTGATSGGLPTMPADVAATHGTSTANVQVSWTASTTADGPTHTYFVTALTGMLQSSPSPSDTGYRAQYPLTGYQLSIDGGITYTDLGIVTGYTDTAAPVGTWTSAVSASDGVPGKVTLGLAGVTEQPASRTYQVRAVSGVGASPASTASGFRAVGSPTGYQWQWSDTNAGTYTDLAGATTTSFDDTTGPVITQRFYRCVLSGANGATATIGPADGYRGLEAPTSLAASNGTSSAHVSVTWNAVYGATGYRIFRNGSSIADVSATSYDDTGAGAGGAPSAPFGFTATQGTILASVDLAWSAPSSTTGAMETYVVKALVGTTEGPMSNADTGWRAAFAITGYEISLDNGSTYAGAGTGTSYSDTTAPLGDWTALVSATDSTAGKVSMSVSNINERFVSRSYAVRAVNAAGAGAAAFASGYRDVGNPTGFQWQWSDTMNGTYTDLGSATTNPYDDTTGPVEVARFYRCVLTGANGATGIVGPDPGTRRVTAPTNLVASDGTSPTHVSLTWTAVTGATGYRIFRDAIAIADVATTSYDDTGATFGGKAPIPGNFTASTTFVDRVDLSWNTSSGSAGPQHNYQVVALVNTAVGPFSTADTGNRGPLPTTYELQIGTGSFTNLGSATTYSDTTAPAATFDATVKATDGKQGVISLSLNVSSSTGAGVTYTLRAVNTNGSLGSSSVIGRRGVGALTYQWQRSAGTSDGSYSNIGGATAVTYDDTSSIPTFEPRWYQCVITRDGISSVTTAPDPGWRGVQTTPTSSMWIANGRNSVGVRATAVANGILYIGGKFSYVGPKTGTFTKIDSSGVADLTWPKVSGSVEAVAADGSGGWYIGGSISTVDGVAVERLVHITSAGARDTTFAPGAFDGAVNAIVVNGGQVYVGGSFTTIGGVTRNRLAAFDATTGALTSTWNPNATGTVNTMVVVGTKLYVGGAFTSVSSTVRNRVAAVDLSTGALDTWNPNADAEVKQLQANGTTLYMMGGFANVSNTTRKYLAAVDTAGTLTAWNPNPNSFIKTIQVAPSTVYVSGVYSMIGGGTRGGVAAVDLTTGTVTSWQPPSVSNVYTFGLDGDTLYIGGGFTSVGGSPRANVAALDASTGILLPWNPGANDWLTNGAIVSDGTHVFVGSSLISFGGETRNNVAAIDLATGAATAWDPSVGPFDADVYAITVSADNSTVYIGGTFSTVGIATRHNIAAISASTGAATSWNPDGGTSGSVRSLALSGSTLYTGGDFTTMGGATRGGLAALSTSSNTATSWDPGSTDGPVYALLVSGTTLYAGGSFSVIGAAARSRIAAISTTTGAALPGWDPGASNTVRALALSGSRLFVGGGFTTLGGQSRSRLAALDATAGTLLPWAPFSAGDVGSIAISSEALYYCSSTGTRATSVSADDGTTDWTVSFPGSSDCSMSISGTNVIGGGRIPDSIAVYAP